MYACKSSLFKKTILRDEMYSMQNFHEHVAILYYKYMQRKFEKVEIMDLCQPHEPAHLCLLWFCS